MPIQSNLTFITCSKTTINILSSSSNQVLLAPASIKALQQAGPQRPGQRGLSSSITIDHKDLYEWITSNEDNNTVCKWPTILIPIDVTTILKLFISI